MYITLTEKIDELTQILYKFWFNDSDFKFILGYYAIQHRKTKRHGFRSPKFYSRLNKRDSKILRGNIQIPNKIKEELIQALISKIEIED